MSPFFLSQVQKKIIVTSSLVLATFCKFLFNLFLVANSFPRSQLRLSAFCSFSYLISVTEC